MASGLQPYRGPSGLLLEHDPAVHADVSTLERDPMAVWRFFGPLRQKLQEVEFNSAHETLFQVMKSLQDGQRFTLITQNVDGLHQKAGNHDVIELHGSLRHTRCSNSTCELPAYEDLYTHCEKIPLCDLCKSPLRPDIVLFNEPIPPRASWLAKQALRECDLFLAIGTSGTVSPASNFVRSADYAGARTIFVNLTPMEPHNPYFKEQILGKVEELLPALLLGIAVK